MLKLPGLEDRLAVGWLWPKRGRDLLTDVLARSDCLISFCYTLYSRGAGQASPGLGRAGQASPGLGRVGQGRAGRAAGSGSVQGADRPAVSCCQLLSARRSFPSPWRRPAGPFSPTSGAYKCSAELAHKGCGILENGSQGI